MSNGCRKNSPSYLCEEILIDILVTLPVKSLLRFMCVSKSWQDLISSSTFASRHLSNVRNRGPTYIITFRKGYMFSRKSFKQCLESNHPLRSKKRYGIYGSSNGLLCISDRELRWESTTCIWNPSLRKIRTLPASAIPTPSGSRKLMSLSFGFNPEVNDYKVVKMVQFYRLKLSFALEVYSLSTQSWKMIDSGFPTWLEFSWWRSWGCDFLKGVVYWLIKPRDSLTFSVVSFDTATETFQDVLVPNAVCGFLPIVRPKDNLIIQMYKESICLLRCSGSDDGNKDVKLWVLQDQSLCTFVIPSAGKCSLPLRFKTNDELLVAAAAISIDEHNFKRELISYNLESKEVKRTGIWLKSQGGYFCYPHTHVESLVLLND